MKKKYKFKFTFIKKYEVDLWGYLTSCSIERLFFKKIFKTICYKYKHKIRIVRFFFKKYFKTFIYSKNMPKKRHRKFFNKDYIKQVHILLFFRIFYGDFSIKKFKRYLKRVNTRRIDYRSKIIFLLESRLDILLYRLNLSKNPRESRNFIKGKKILINNLLITKLNHQLYINDVISLHTKYKKFFYRRLFIRLQKGQILFNYPKYLETNYKLLKCIFILYPKKKEIPSIWKLNLSFLRTFI